MKKLISVLLLLCFMTGILASCAPKDEQSETPSDVTDDNQTPSTDNGGDNSGNNENNNNNNNDNNNDDNNGNTGVVDTRDYLFNATFDNVQNMNEELDGTGFTLEADSGSWTLVKGADGYLDNPKNDGRLFVNDNDLLLDDGAFVIQMSVKFASMPTNKISLLTWVRKSTTANSVAYDWIVKIDNAGKLYVDSDTTATSTTLETGKDYVISVLVSGGQAKVMVDGEVVGTKKMASKELVSSRIRIFENGKANYNADIGSLAIYTPDTLELLGDAEMSVFDALSKNANATPYFAGYSDKDALTYAVGEEMTFEIFLMADDKVVSAPYFYYTVEGEDGQEKTEGLVDGSLGHFTVKGSMSKPGTLRITVYVCDENQEILAKNNSELYQTGSSGKETLIFRGGAIAGFDDIRAAGETPDDLAEYWDEIVSDCYEGDIVLQRFEELDVADYNEDKASTHKLYLVEIECEGGFATGYLSLPIGATELRLKASFVSYGNKKKPTPEFSNDGAVFAICAHSFHLDDPNAQAPDGYGFDITENQDRDTVYFKNMFIRNVTATRFLKAYIGDNSYGRIVYNGETVAPLNLWSKGDSFTVNGGSQAAFQCVAITALDKDVTRAILGLTWFCDIGGESIGRFEGWNPEYTDALMYYDCCSLATLIGENVEVSISAAGLGDTTSEPSGIVALYNALNCKVTLTVYQNRSHTYNPPSAETYKKNK